MFRYLLASVCLLGCSLPFYAQSLMLKNGCKFLDIPYVAHTLETKGTEKLVIRCEEVDCTTFVEYVLAMTLTSSQDSIPKEEFVAQLQRIRYRDGIINGYTSRLHYITDWIDNGIRNGFLIDITEQESPYTLRPAIHFMSTHPESYPVLAESGKDLQSMQSIEKRLSEKTIHYLPKDKLTDNGLCWIKEGDILAMTTRIAGLDVSHIGLAYYKNGNLHLLHASSSAKKVLISSHTLAEMMKKNRNWTGIRVIRYKK